VLSRSSFELARTCQSSPLCGLSSGESETCARRRAAACARPRLLSRSRVISAPSLRRSAITAAHRRCADAGSTTGKQDLKYQVEVEVPYTLAALSTQSTGLLDLVVSSLNAGGSGDEQPRLPVRHTVVFGESQLLSLNATQDFFAQIQTKLQGSPVTSKDAPPFLPFILARKQLQVVSAWLSTLARRLRVQLLHSRSVTLDDRKACEALLRAAPTVAAQLLHLVALPFERAAGIVNTMDALQRERLLKCIDATAKGAELAWRPTAAARELSAMPPHARAGVLETMPRLAAAAALRAMRATMRSETWRVLTADVKSALAELQAFTEA